MPDDPSAAALLREVGLLADGPATFGRPIRAQGSGVFVVELSAALPSAPLELPLELDELQISLAEMQGFHGFRRISHFGLPSCCTRSPIR